MATARPEAVAPPDEVEADDEEEGPGGFAALGRTELGASITVQVGRADVKLRTKFDKFAKRDDRVTGV